MSNLERLDADELRNLVMRARNTDLFHNVLTNFVAASRWGIHWETIVRDLDEDKYYGIAWSEGATEMQDMDSFEEGTYEVYPVTPMVVEKVTYVKD